MKTQLPEAITTVEEAEKFLGDLIKNRETYHPEDNAHDCFTEGILDNPTPAECDRLNKLMNDIYALPGNDGRHGDPLAFDPCWFIINNTQKIYDSTVHQ